MNTRLAFALTAALLSSPAAAQITIPCTMEVPPVVVGLQEYGPALGAALIRALGDIDGLELGAADRLLVMIVADEALIVIVRGALTCGLPVVARRAYERARAMLVGEEL